MRMTDGMAIGASEKIAPDGGSWRLYNIEGANAANDVQSKRFSDDAESRNAAEDGGGGYDGTGAMGSYSPEKGPTDQVRFRSQLSAHASDAIFQVLSSLSKPPHAWSPTSAALVDSLQGRRLAV